jgi:type I restriction enzyme M protein
VSLNCPNFIWSVADLLRGSFKAYQYGDIILLFTVLRRLDCVLARPPQLSGISG